MWIDSNPFCGEKYLTHHFNLHRPFSITSSASEMIIAIVSFLPYTDLKLSFSIKTTPCKGLFWQSIYTVDYPCNRHNQTDLSIDLSRECHVLHIHGLPQNRFCKTSGVHPRLPSFLSITDNEINRNYLHQHNKGISVKHHFLLHYQRTYKTSKELKSYLLKEDLQTTFVTEATLWSLYTEHGGMQSVSFKLDSVYYHLYFSY